MQLLVTGSSGQIGSYVVERARAEGLEVVGLDLEPSPWTTVVGDVREPADCRAALSGCQAVIHLAAQVSVEASVAEPVEDASHNVLGTLQLLEAARAAGIQRFVNVSSAAVLGDPVHLPIDEEHPTRPMSPYGASKLAAERYGQLYQVLHGLPVTTVRPFNVYSPRQDPNNPYTGVMAAFADRVRNDKAPVVHGEGTQTRDLVHARDVARWLVQLATGAVEMPEGNLVHLGSGQETSVRQLAELFLEAAGLDQEPVHADRRAGDIDRSVADTTRMGKLGLVPEVDLAQGVRELVHGPPDGG